MKTLAAFALAVAVTTTNGQAAEPAAKGEPKMICKRDKQGVETGSNFRSFGKRVCRTQARWDELERDAREAFQRIDQTATRQQGYVPPSQRGE